MILSLSTCSKHLALHKAARELLSNVLEMFSLSTCSKHLALYEAARELLSNVLEMFFFNFSISSHRCAKY
jgi:hypothetical protein